MTKFSSDSVGSTIEHTARYIVEMEEIAFVEYRTMRFFFFFVTNFLTKNAFSWFLNLRPNSFLTWVHLEKNFHKQFFQDAIRVSLTDLFFIKRYPRVSIDDYLA